MKYFRFTCTYIPSYDTIVNRVSRFCRYLSAMYEYYFKPIKTAGVSSLHVCFVDKQPDDYVEVATIKDCFVITDWNNLQKLTEEDLMRHMLECCQEEIIGCAIKEGWLTHPFEKAYLEIVQKDYLFKQHHKKPVLSQNKQYRAQLYYEFDYKSDGAYVEITDKEKRIINRIQFAPSGYLVICGSIGTISWLNDNTVRVSESNRCSYWTVGLNGNVEYGNIKADKNDAHALYQLGVDYFNGIQVLKDEQKGFQLVQKSAELGYKHAKKWIERIRK